MTISFETSPDRYRHWQLSVHGDVASINMDVQEDAGLRSDYKLKLNSYDLAVDIELADAIQRLRFEHPEVRTVVLRSNKNNIFCAGANIFMLGSSGHGFKVNFCKFTNETRLSMEDAAEFSGQHYIAACNGTTAGGGYELALACEEIILVDDGNSAVSLPETPLLAVLPGTGGLTRLVDKRKVRRDRADVFCTLAEGIKGQRAVEWGFVDQVVPRSKFEETVQQRAKQKAAEEKLTKGPGIKLNSIHPYKYVKLETDRARRIAAITIQGPGGDQPNTAEAIHQAGSEYWPLRAFREMDDAFLNLRFNEPEAGLILIRTKGDHEAVRAIDETLKRLSDDWLVKEILLFMKRTLKRVDLTARTMFALIEPGSCFSGSLLELALAADRSYMLDSPDDPVLVGLSSLNDYFPMSNGLTRLQSRFLNEPDRVKQVLSHRELMDAREAEKNGLITFAIDDLDYEDDVRVAIEERASLSPDALTGMEASLRFAGPETMETKIFGRLSAWQNWIFTRPNATGEHGALTLYGKPERPTFDWKRT